MGLNKNHETEEYNGVKCSIVEKGISKERADFLKELLAFNGYQVEVAPNIPKEKAIPTLKPEDIALVVEPFKVEEPVVITSYNIGVTNLLFNPTNAIFGRLLKTADGHVVTLAFWQQKENSSHDEIPYYETKP